ncbi:MAG: hypothetical protein ACOWWO_19195 [Peptococcaceae bacterium]
MEEGRISEILNILLTKVDVLVEGQRSLEDGQRSLAEGQQKLEAEVKDIKLDVKDLRKDVDKLMADSHIIKSFLFKIDDELTDHHKRLRDLERKRA